MIMFDAAAVFMGMTAYPLQTIIEIVLGAGAIIAILFAAFELIPYSKFAVFWNSIETPPPPPPEPVKINWVMVIVILGSMLALILISLWLMILLQNQLPNLNGCNDPKNMSQVCQNFRDIVNNAGSSI